MRSLPVVLARKRAYSEAEEAGALLAIPPGEEMTMPASRTFTVRIERDTESGWLVGEVLELPGCYTQAPDLNSLQANVEEAIEAYLQTVDPDEVSATYVGTLEVRVPA